MCCPEIETARLLLRRLLTSDLEDYTRMYGNPEYTRYSFQGVVPKEQALVASIESFENISKHWEKYGFGSWAVIEKPTNKFIGECGLSVLFDRSQVQVVYRLDQPYWNRGLTTEAAKASLRYGFEELKLERIVAITSRQHNRSRRVMEKIGLQYEKDVQLLNRELVYYFIDRRAYQRDNSPYILHKKSP